MSPTKQSPGKHLLHIVQFSRARGIVRLPPIPLDDFQVHAMKCHATVVELEAWTTAYAVDISDRSHPTVATRPTKFDPTQPFSSTNLGHWAREGVIDLEGDGAPGEFQLVIARVSRRAQGRIEHYLITELIQRDLQPRGGAGIRASLKLFEGVFGETFD